MALDDKPVGSRNFNLSGMSRAVITKKLEDYESQSKQLSSANYRNKMMNGIIERLQEKVEAACYDHETEAQRTGDLISNVISNAMTFNMIPVKYVTAITRWDVENVCFKVSFDVKYDTF